MHSCSNLYMILVILNIIRFVILLPDLVSNTIFDSSSEIGATSMLQGLIDLPFQKTATNPYSLQ